MTDAFAEVHLAKESSSSCAPRRGRNEAANAKAASAAAGPAAQVFADVTAWLDLYVAVRCLGSPGADSL